MKVTGRPIEAVALQEDVRCLCGDELATTRLTISSHEMDLGPGCLSGLHTQILSSSRTRSRERTRSSSRIPSSNRTLLARGVALQALTSARSSS